VLVAQILSLPRSLRGDVVECGCFKGSSTASLSLACSLVGRKLVACDSFAGLPRPKKHDLVHLSLDARRYETYKEGDFCGTLDEVQDNVRRYGAIECCEFVKGFFEDTLESLGRDLALIFLDVDLHDSLKTCLLALWPHLQEYGYLYTHEAKQLDLMATFFDKAWWRKHLDCDPPGLVGTGSGLPLGVASGSGIGYTVKLPRGVDVGAESFFHHFRASPPHGNSRQR